MCEEPANKRRRFDGPSSNTRRKRKEAACINALPDAVLQQCFTFIGPGDYRYVAGTSHRFLEIYGNEHENKTTWSSATGSVSRAELCVKEDTTEEPAQGNRLSLEKMTEQAILIGKMDILEWARGKSYEFKDMHFCAATFNGHLPVLQWAETKGLNWYSESVIRAAAVGGHIKIIAWIQSTGRRMPMPIIATIAATKGQLTLLNWMKERDLVGEGKDLANHASVGGCTEVLDWVLNNNYECDLTDIVAYGCQGNHKKVLIWARDHGYVFEEISCAFAAAFGSLCILQWLRENECPWDDAVVHFARENGHDQLLQWAIDNGCPTPE